MKSTVKRLLHKAIEKIGSNQHERWSRHGMYQPVKKTIESNKKKDG